MPQLVVEKGNDRDRAVAIKPGDKIVVGRDVKANLRVEDVMTSRKHFAIISHKDDFYVKDLKSANGTFLNGKKIEQEKLSIGDRIQIGETVLSFLNEDEGKKKGGLVGKEIAGYLIEERLGRGAMGTVYLAKQISLDRHVALKILAPELLKDKSFVEMFIKEARACGKLNHPNIIQVYDVGSFKGVYYFSMEYVEKGGVADLLTNNRSLPLEEAIPMVKDACQALAYAERQQIIHRDIKPDNLFLNADNVVKIGDLGLAHSAQEDVGADGVFGTPHYIAPEQAMGEKLDHRADIYALGCTFYRMATGQTPYRGQNVQEILRKQVKAPPPYAAERPDDLPEDVHWPSIPRPVADIIYKMMAKNRDERYASATAILPELDQALANLDRKSQRLTAGAVAGAAGDAATRLVEGLRRGNNLPLYIGLGVFVLLIVIGAIIALSGGEKPDPNANTKPADPVQITLDPFKNKARPGNQPANNDNAGGNQPPQNNDPDPFGNNDQSGDPDGQEIRRRRQELFEQMAHDVQRILIEHQVAEKGLAEPQRVPDACMAMLQLALKYETDEQYADLLTLDDGTKVDSHLKKCARQLESIYEGLAELNRTHDADHAACLKAANEAIQAGKYGDAIRIYRAFAAKYWWEESRQITLLRDWVKDNAKDVDTYVDGYPGALDVRRYPDGKVYELIKQIGGQYDTAFAEMEKALQAEQSPDVATDYQKRRDLLRPHADFMAQVVNVWQVPNDVLSPTGKVIAIQSKGDLEHLGLRLEAINAAEKQGKLNAVARLREETRTALKDAQTAAGMLLDLNEAVKIFTDLSSSETWEAALEDQGELANKIRWITVGRASTPETGKIAQLRRAATFLDQLIAKIKSDKPTISKPEALENPDFRSTSKVEVTAITPAQDGKPCLVTLEYRGRVEKDFPLARLNGTEFWNLCNDVMKLDGSRDAEMQVNAALLMMERRQLGESVKILEQAVDRASGARKAEYIEYLSWALLMGARLAIDAGNGTTARELLDKFKQHKDTAAWRYANGDRPLGD